MKLGFISYSVRMSHSTASGLGLQLTSITYRQLTLPMSIILDLYPVPQPRLPVTKSRTRIHQPLLQEHMLVFKFFEDNHPEDVDVDNGPRAHDNLNAYVPS